MARKVVTLLVPAHNEDQTLFALKSEIDRVTSVVQDYDWEFLFVNDGSTDSTLRQICNLRKDDERVSYVDLSRNFGKENAMLAGLDYAKGDAVIILDADLQDPPSLILEMLHWWELGYDDVYAKRRDRGKESFIRKKLSLIFYKILHNSARFEILENVGDFRLLDRVCVNALCSLRETERYTKGLFCWIGFRKKEIVFDRSDRIAGQSNWNFMSLINLAIDGLTSFTTMPLRISSIAGAITAFWAICYIVWILFKTLVWGDPVAGYPTIMSVMLFLGGIQLLALGIIGEYIGRIYNESKRRPSYIVREYNGHIISNSNEK